MNRILCVEDDEVTVAVFKSIVSKILKDVNYTLDIAENGKEGLAKAVNGGYDVIFSDIKMPVMDGYEMINRIRLKERSVPIVVLTTASNFDEVKESLSRRNDVHVFQKPYDVVWLKCCLEEILRLEPKSMVEHMVQFSGNVRVKLAKGAAMTDDLFVKLILEEAFENDAIEGYEINVRKVEG